jgi:hypothetical protein
MDQLVIRGTDATPDEAGNQNQLTIGPATGVPMDLAVSATPWADTVPGWRKGMTSFVPEQRAACCPNCGKNQPHWKSSNGSDTLGRWYCSRCEHRWKGHAAKFATVTLIA